MTVAERLAMSAPHAYLLARLRGCVLRRGSYFKILWARGE